jgi:hypothetical protein
MRFVFNLTFGRLAFGGWLLAFGSWQLAISLWQVTFGSWQMAILFTLLNRNGPAFGGSQQPIANSQQLSAKKDKFVTFPISIDRLG